MSATSITVNQDQLLLTLGKLGAAASDMPSILNTVSAYMKGSVQSTFRDEGSPAGSWPALAASTLRRKGYSAGHKLLILSGRLFSSIENVVEGNVLTIGTSVVYAGVHQWGSADRRGGSVGAQARIPGREAQVGAYDFMRRIPFREFGKRVVRNEFGEDETVKTRLSGPANAKKTSVSAHGRHGNIPARPFLVFRPEDPGNIVEAINGYFFAKAPAGAVTK